MNQPGFHALGTRTMESAAVVDQGLVTGVATQHGSHKGHQPAALVTDGCGQRGQNDVRRRIFKKEHCG